MTIPFLLSRACNHDGLRKYGANTLWLFAEKAVRMALGLTVGVYIARQLGPAQYGLLNYAISFVAIFSVVISLGLDAIVVRELVRQPQRRMQILGSALGLEGIGYLLMLCGVGVGLHFSDNDRTTNLLILVIAAGYLFQVLQPIDYFFQAEVKSKYIAVTQMAAWILVSAGRAFCAWRGYPLIYFAGLEAANIALQGLGYAICYQLTSGNLLHWRFEPATARRLFKDSWMLLLSGMIGIVYMRIDQVMIKAMLGDAAVGYYAAAVRLSELWYFVPTLVCTSLFPAIIRAKTVSQAHYERRLQMLYNLLASFSLLLAVAVMLFGSQVVTLLYGEAYSPAIGILNIYIWSVMTIALTSALGRWMLVENLQLILMLAGAVGVMVNIGLNYLFIRRYGLNGAALATIISPLCNLAVIFICNKPSRSQFRCIIKAIFLVWVIRLLKTFPEIRR